MYIINICYLYCVRFVSTRPTAGGGCNILESLLVRALVCAVPCCVASMPARSSTPARGRGGVRARDWRTWWHILAYPHIDTRVTSSSEKNTCSRARPGGFSFRSIRHPGPLSRQNCFAWPCLWKIQKPSSADALLLDRWIATLGSAHGPGSMAWSLGSMAWALRSFAWALGSVAWPLGSVAWALGSVA